MTFTVLAHLFSTLLDFLRLFGRSDQEKDLEILLLRQQLRLLQQALGEFFDLAHVFFGDGAANAGHDYYRAAA